MHVMWRLAGCQDAVGICSRRTSASVGPLPCSPCQRLHQPVSPALGDKSSIISSSGPACRVSSSFGRHRARFPDGRLSAVAAPADAQVAGGNHETEDPLAARLKAWVLEHSKTLPTQLTPVRQSNGTYGLVTDEPVRRGQILVRVPRQLLLSLETARASPVCGQLVQSVGLSEWQALLLHLLCERARGQRSFWAPYLDTLPADMSHHPLLWGPDRLSWLAGSPLVAQLAARQAQVDEDTEALLVAGANELPLAEELRREAGVDLVTRGSVGWAAAVLLSRSFSLDLSEEEPLEGDMGYFGTWTAHAPDVLALVPWADMLAHCCSAGPESCAAYQYDLAAVTLSAHRDYRPGQTAQDSHGQHLSPVDLAMDYGVEDPAVAEQLRAEVEGGSAGAEARGGPEAGVLEGRGEDGAEAAVAGGAALRHRFDADPADVAVPRSLRNAALLRALAAVQGEGACLVLGERGPDTASLTYLRATLAADVELVRAGWRVKATDKDVELACRVMGSLAEPTAAATERVLLGALAAFVEAALGRFPTRLEDDEARLMGRGGSARVEGPERLALVALVSQKRALLGSRRAVATWLGKLESGVPVAELYDDEFDVYDDDWGEGEDDGTGQEGPESDGWDRGARPAGVRGFSDA